MDEMNLTGECPGEPFCVVDCDPFVCMDCNENTLHMGEYYMVHDYVWEYLTLLSGFSKGGMLCIGCLEHSLNLELTKEFFSDVPLNSSLLGEKSDRLMDRLGYSPDGYQSMTPAHAEDRLLAIRATLAIMKSA